MTKKEKAIYDEIFDTVRWAVSNSPSGADIEAIVEDNVQKILAYSKLREEDFLSEGAIKTVGVCKHWNPQTNKCIYSGCCSYFDLYTGGCITEGGL